MFVGNQITGQVVAYFTAGNVIRWAPIWLVPLYGAAAAAALFMLFFPAAGADQRDEAENKPG
jgi:hypothetical protein